MKQLKIYKTFFTMDDVHDGDIASDDTSEEIANCDPDEGEENEDGSPTTAVDHAVYELQGEELTEPSGSEITPGHTWLTHPDGSYIVDHYKGKHCETSAHFHGDWTDDEIREVFKRLKDS